MAYKKIIRAGGGYTGTPDEPYPWMVNKGLLAPFGKTVSKKPKDPNFLQQNSIGRGYDMNVNVSGGDNTNSLTLPAATRTIGTGTMDVVGKPISYFNTPAANGKGPGLFSRIFNQNTLNKAGKFADDVTPFISNITNAFRKPPMPKYPTLEGFTNLDKVDYSNERYQVGRAVASANKATERNIDSNTAEAIKGFNRGEEFNRMSAINDRENKDNTGIQHQQAMMDAAVKARNVDKIGDYGDALTARAIAHQREQSDNIANAGNKLVLIGNEKKKAKLDLEKTQVLSSIFSKSGVLTRNNSVRAEWKKQGIPDPLGRNYEDLKDDEKAYGGMMTRIPTRKLYK